MNRKLAAFIEGAVVGTAALIAAYALTTNRACSQEVMRPPENITMSVLPPPWRFDHPYRGPVTEYRMFVDAARMLCKKQGAEADSCSWLSKGRCYIVIPWDAPVKDLDQYKRHEIAHCNGWGANHEK